MTTTASHHPRGKASKRRNPRSTRTSSGARGLRDGALFLAPFMLVYVLFLLAPVLQAFFMSGFSWDLLSSVRTFVGTENYVRMLWGTGIEWSATHEVFTRLIILLAAAGVAWGLARRSASKVGPIAVGALGIVLAFLLGFRPGENGSWNDPLFWTSLENTLIFTLVATPLLIGLGLALALLLSGRRRGGNVYRAIFFLPYVLPISAVTLIWSYLLNPDRGLLAGFLGWFGVDGIAFLSNPDLAMPAIIATTVWWSLGFNLVLFLAGLQDIEPSLYEAASLDGANAMQRFRHITWPGLNHVTVLVTITQLIASFQIFGQVYIMTKGGPGTSTVVLIQHIYESGFQNYELGYAATVSVFLFVVMAAVSAIQFRLISKDS